MQIEHLFIPGCLKISPKVFSDTRGTFIKPFVQSEYREAGLCTIFAEEYYSRSYKNVLRGMHFQTPPFDSYKLVSCLQGMVRDVLLDLRMGSPSYGEYEVLELDANIGEVIYLPPGIAHGFLALSDLAIVSYKVTKPFSPQNDIGVRWDSFGFQWGIKNPIISLRDLGFQALKDFSSPFIYEK